jgi:hypothetical protein
MEHPLKWTHRKLPVHQVSTDLSPFLTLDGKFCPKS